MIKLLIIIFIILLVTLGIFMLINLEHPFFIFDQQHLALVQNLMKLTAYLLFLTSIIGIFIVFMAPLSFNVITLVLGSLIVGGFAIIMTRFN